MRLSGAYRKMDASDLNYHDIVKASGGDHQMTSKQIEKDLLRTLPNNVCFARKDSTGEVVPRSVTEKERVKHTINKKCARISKKKIKDLVRLRRIAKW